jgi:16S rRNA (cytosine967-C5)-methyltransferase
VAGVVRRRLYLDWIISHFVKKSLKEDLRYLLWMTLYQVFFMRKAVYHVVDETVEYVKGSKGRDTANFVNAVLRRSIRERESLQFPPDPVLRLSIEQSFPVWLVKRWHARFGTKDTVLLLETLNRSPEFGLRVDTRWITVAAAKQKLLDSGVEVREGKYLEGALRAEKLAPLLTNELFATRLVLVQDETSQMAVLALVAGQSARARSKDLILDACAGQGTKTGQIRQMIPDARIVAMDTDREKLKAIDSTPLLTEGDATGNPFKEASFDSILLDAPCSSLGIVRKHPEIKWRRRETDIVRQAGIQRRMVRETLRALKPGGRLVYSVCSFEPEETVDVMNDFVKEGSLIPDGTVPGASDAPSFLSLPHETGLDGFFIAGFRKP